MNKRPVFFTLLVIIVVGIVYRSWMRSGDIIGGDWPYVFSGAVQGISKLPFGWQSAYGGGMGGIAPAYFLSIYNAGSAWISETFGIPWPLISKIVWFFLPLTLLSAGGWKLYTIVYPDASRLSRVLASVIIATNTYVLMLAGGGQMGVFWAVSLTCWVLWSFFRFLAATNLFRAAVLLGVLFGIQVSFDPRIAYVTAFMMVMIFLTQGTRFVRQVMYGGMAAAISILLNAYWLLPVALLKANPFDSLGDAYTSINALSFFSFADFSHAFSLLHPNWPENIFGKTRFLQPEFLVLPLLAFGSLLLRKNKNNWIFPFAVLALVGAFLSKGTNPPFGTMYVWLFTNVPGFIMFRDPMKWYLMIVVSYTVLIPFVFSRIDKRFRFATVLFFLVWGILHRQVFTGQLSGTFMLRTVPDIYKELSDWQSGESGFYRTLWVPRQSRFAYSSHDTIPIEAGPLLGATDSATLARAFISPDTEFRLSSLGIRYVIVPFDPYGEIFQEDRKFSSKKRMEIVEVLDSIAWLTRIRSDDVAIYKTRISNDHFWLTQGVVTGIDRVSDGIYEVTVSTEQPATLFFSESYHPGWTANVVGQRIVAEKALQDIMSFKLPDKGAQKVTVEFTPRYVFIAGFVISAALVALLLGYNLLWILKKLPY